MLLPHLLPSQSFPCEWWNAVPSNYISFFYIPIFFIYYIYFFFDSIGNLVPQLDWSRPVSNRNRIVGKRFCVSKVSYTWTLPNDIRRRQRQQGRQQFAIAHWPIYISVALGRIIKAERVPASSIPASPKSCDHRGKWERTFSIRELWQPQSQQHWVRTRQQRWQTDSALVHLESVSIGIIIIRHWSMVEACCSIRHQLLHHQARVRPIRRPHSHFRRQVPYSFRHWVCYNSINNHRHHHIKRSQTILTMVYRHGCLPLLENRLPAMITIMNWPAPHRLQTVRHQTVLH